MNRTCRLFLPTLLALVVPTSVLAQFGGVAIERRIDPATPGESQVVVANVGSLIHTAQLLPVDADGRLVGAGDAGAQIAQLFANLRTTLAAAKADWRLIAKLNVYVADDAVAMAFRRELAEKFADHPVAVAFVVTRLPVADALVALDAVAVSLEPLAREDVPRIRVPTLAAGPRLTHLAITPSGSRVYVAGQAEKGTLRDATRKTLESLDATLRFLKLEWTDVAQIKSFVTPMSAVSEAEDEVRKFFGERSVPPLVWVEWESSLPIEIELVASANRGRAASLHGQPGDVEFLTPPGMTTPTIYARVTRMHGPKTLYVGGLYGEPNRDGGTQVEQIFARLRKLLDESGSDLTHLVKATYYVSDNDASAKLNELRPRYYDPKRPPAASKAQVKGVARPGATITLDMIAAPRE